MSESATKVKWTKGVERAAKLIACSHKLRPLVLGSILREEAASEFREIISRETRDREMAELLREVIEWQATNADHLSRSLSAELRAMAKNAEALLAEID